MTETPQPLAVDYSGRSLTEGDTIGFIGTDPVCLRQGRIRVIGPNDLCIESGVQLVVFTGTHAGWAEPAARPLGGKTVPNEDLAHVRAYPHVALQAPEGQATVFDETVRRHQGAITRVDELLAVIEQVRGLASRLDEFGENALKADDRELYTAIAKDLRDRIDGPAPNAEDDA